MSTPSPRRIVRFVGVYDADSTLRGELAYWIGARLGRTHCALCDITHGLVRERTDWRSCRDTLAVPFDTYHRNDQPQAVRDAVDGIVPVVVAETDGGIVMLLGPADLDDCGGEPERLLTSLSAAIETHGLTV